MGNSKGFNVNGMEFTQEDIVKALSDIMRGNTDFTINGECSECGECCSNLLPMSKDEIKAIRKVVREQKIQPLPHNVTMLESMDWLCPFLDTNKENHKCVIYQHRPLICRDFSCHNMAIGKRPGNEMIMNVTKCDLVNVRKEFWNQDGNIL